MYLKSLSNLENVPYVCAVWPEPPHILRPPSSSRSPSQTPFLVFEGWGLQGFSTAGLKDWPRSFGAPLKFVDGASPYGATWSDRTVTGARQTPNRNPQHWPLLSKYGPASASGGKLTCNCGRAFLSTFYSQCKFSSFWRYTSVKHPIKTCEKTNWDLSLL